MASRVLQVLELKVLARVRVLEVGVVKVGLTVVEELEVGVGEDGVMVVEELEVRLVETGVLEVVVGEWEVGVVEGKMQSLTLWEILYLSVRTFLPVTIRMLLTSSATQAGVVPWMSSWRTALNGIPAMQTLRIQSGPVPRTVA